MMTGAALAFMACALLLGSGATPAHAQGTGQAPAVSSSSPTAFGSIRTREYGWNWFGDDPGGKYAYPASLIRLGLSRSKPSLDWKIEFALPVLLKLPESAVLPAPQGQLGLGATYFAANDNADNAAALFPKQAFVKFTHLGAVDGQSLTVGRMEFNDGSEVTPENETLASLKRERISQRLIGVFGFSDVGRSIDGAQYVRGGDKTNVTAIAGRPTQGVFQVSGWRELNIVLGYGAVTRQVGSASAPGEWRIFGLGYDDYRQVVKADNRPAGARNADQEPIAIATLGGHYIHLVPTRAGPVDMLVWAAAQSGSWGRLSHRAAAFAAEAGWQPSAASAVQLWLRGGYDYASGDGDPNDDVHGTFFQVLPTPRIYARLPFYNMMNSIDSFGELIVKPRSTLTVRTDIHSIHLADAQDLWYSGGGAFQPQTFGFIGRPSGGASALATLYDASVDYTAGTHVTLSGYVGYATAGRVAQAIYSTDAGVTLAYLEVLVRF